MEVMHMNTMKEIEIFDDLFSGVQLHQYIIWALVFQCSKWLIVCVWLIYIHTYFSMFFWLPIWGSSSSVGMSRTIPGC